MSRRSPFSCLASWAAACALVLQAAVPLLAAGAAHVRDVPVAEVCAVYGIALPTRTHDAQAEHGHHDHGSADSADDGSPSPASHSANHCALTSLAALGTLPDAAVPPAAMHTVHVPPPARTCGGFPDACAAWAARHHHGPPALG